MMRALVRATWACRISAAPRSAIRQANQVVPFGIA